MESFHTVPSDGRSPEVPVASSAEPHRRAFDGAEAGGWCDVSQAVREEISRSDSPKPPDPLLRRRVDVEQRLGRCRGRPDRPTTPSEND